ncbi:MAG: tetratricopeptide repeat protein [Alphaproteobacteria bacterium]|nr:tetratricopeptide repeat protein [Alphaproteobacteria bacterium]
MAASDSLDLAIAHGAASADALCDLAVGHHRNGEPERAVAACIEALALAPDHGPARLNLACILRELDRLEEAVAHASRAEAVGLARGDRGLVADARFNRGLARLGLGELAEGWADWDARLSQPQWLRFDPARRWNGEPLAGRRLVVRREQGIGDELVFATCYRALLERCAGPEGGPVLFECDLRIEAALARALPGAALHGIDTVAGRAAAQAGRTVPPSARRAPEGDLWVAAGSLPGLVGRPIDLAPDGALLAPLPALATHWRQRVDALPSAGPVVGLCWRSSMAGNRRDRLQAAIGDLAPLLRLPGIRPVGLQIAPRPEELAEAEALAGRKLETFADLDLANDFEQALALVAACDLVIAVGTWIVPLAGMAGTPAWYLMPLRDYWTVGTETIPWFDDTRCYDAREGRFADAAARMAQDIRLGGWR